MPGLRSAMGTPRLPNRIHQTWTDYEGDHEEILKESMDIVWVMLPRIESVAIAQVDGVRRECVPNSDSMEDPVTRLDTHTAGRA